MASLMCKWLESVGEEGKDEEEDDEAGPSSVGRSGPGFGSTGNAGAQEGASKTDEFAFLQVVLLLVYVFTVHAWYL